MTLAFDWTARAEIQGDLKALAARLDMKSRPGLHAAAHEMARLLTAHGSAARVVFADCIRGEFHF